MADRRMFAKTIIDSDAFLDMPLSSQALYFHLSMRADDEGFINNPKKIQRMIGASEDDLKVLIAKSFIIPFESGIVVIKHWKIHNYIRGDRLKNTVYEEEKNLLEVKDNGAYTLNTELKEIEKLDSNDKRKIAYHNSSLPYSFEYKIKRAFDGMECPICNKIMRSSYKLCMPTIQHNLPISKGGQHEIDNISVICESCNTSIKDNETDSLNNAKVIEVWDKICIAEKEKIKWFDNPQILENIDVSQVTDKCQSSDSIGKDSIGKDSIGKDSIDYKLIADMYNDTCVSFPKVTKLSDARREAIKARLRTYSIDDFKKMFEMAEASSFLKGSNNHNWSANFDWMIKDSNMAKILDGNYSEKKPEVNAGNSNNLKKLEEFFMNN